MKIEAPNYNLFSGDCLEEMKLIPDGYVDTVIVDLPYNCLDSDWDKAIDLAALWKEYNRIVKKDGNVVMFSQQPFTTDLINSNRKNFKYEVIYHKSHPSGLLNAKRRPLRAHENILIFYRKYGTYNIQYEGEPYVRKNIKSWCRSFNIANAYDGTKDMHYPGKHPISIRKHKYAPVPGAQKKKIHPTQKPHDLLYWLVKTYSNENEIILDNTAGSGSTGVAALKAGRRFIGIEKDDTFFEWMKEHIEKAANEESN